jgi:hypothetical protein
VAHLPTRKKNYFLCWTRVRWFLWFCLLNRKTTTTTFLFHTVSISLLRPTPGNRGSNPEPPSQESAAFTTRPHRPTIRRQLSPDSTKPLCRVSYSFVVVESGNK